MAKKLFSDFIPSGTKLHVRPIPYESDRLQDYTSEKLMQDIEASGLNEKDLVKLLDMDKTSVMRMISPDHELSKVQKAMFYYMFKFLRSQNITSNF